MEYSGVNSEDQTDIAEMLNSFFTEVGPSLSGDVTEVDFGGGYNFKTSPFLGGKCFSGKCKMPNSKKHEEGESNFMTQPTAV